MKFDEQLSLSCIISEVKRDIIMFGTRKATMVDLQDDEKSLRICSLVSIQFTNVTDRRTGISRRHMVGKNAVFQPISRRSCLSYNRYSSVRYERHNINAFELQLQLQCHIK